MKIVSLNIGLPRDVVWHGRTVTTAIYKNPVDGRVSLRRLNLDGDRQADLSVHGGEFKAVYCYPRCRNRKARVTSCGTARQLEGALPRSAGYSITYRIRATAPPNRRKRV